MIDKIRYVNIEFGFHSFVMLGFKVFINPAIQSLVVSRRPARLSYVNIKIRRLVSIIKLILINNHANIRVKCVVTSRRSCRCHYLCYTKRLTLKSYATSSRPGRLLR